MSDLVWIIVFLVSSIMLASGCLAELIQKEEELPKEKRCMNPFVIACYWIVFLLFSIFGSAPFYWIAKCIINRRVAAYAKTQENSVPVQTSNPSLVHAELQQRQQTPGGPIYQAEPPKNNLTVA